MGIKVIKIQHYHPFNRRAANVKIHRPSSSASPIRKNKNKNHKSKNIKQILILSFDALRGRKSKSALTLLMVIVGSGLMIALNGMNAGQSNFIKKQMNMSTKN